MIVGIAGLAGAGKNTAAEVFQLGGLEQHSFANLLKCAVAETFGISFSSLDHPDLKDRPFLTPIILDTGNIHALSAYLRGHTPIDISTEQLNNMVAVGRHEMMKSPRELLRFVGTELIRNCVNDNFWVDAIGDVDNVVFTDVRFKNERDFIRKNGGKLVLIKRGGEARPQQWHASERSFGDDSEYDTVIYNNGTIAELHKKVDMWFTAVRAMEKLYG